MDLTDPSGAIGDEMPAAGSLSGASPQIAPADPLERLEQRFGLARLHRRLEDERAHEARRRTERLRPFRVETWSSADALIRNTLRAAGLYRRGQRNAARIEIRRNPVALPNLPAPFDGFTILHLSDLHVDVSTAAMDRLDSLLGDLDYDLCVLTGDYRGRTFGPFAATLDGLERLRRRLKGPVYAVLGNHDSILMVPAMEDLGIAMLVNDRIVLRRDEARLHLAGIDDAHYYRADDIDAVAAPLPSGDCAILLSHTPEVFRRAAGAGFDLMLAGHTHGGQICLPGAIPVTLEATLPRRLGAGAWRYRRMLGYTSRGVGASLVPVRLNCRPEITLHHLRRP